MTDDVFNLSRRTLFQIAGALLTASVPGFAFAQTTDGKFNIGVIGSGSIGGTIGGLWVKAGYPVLFSSRHPEELKPLSTALAPWRKPDRLAPRSILARPS